MKSRESVDPNLHTLRTVIATLDGRAAQTLASARFHLYKAFETTIRSPRTSGSKHCARGSARFGRTPPVKCGYMTWRVKP